MKIVFLSRNCVHYAVSSIVIGSLWGLISIHINIMPLKTLFLFSSWASFRRARCRWPVIKTSSSYVVWQFIFLILLYFNRCNHCQCRVYCYLPISNSKREKKLNSEYDISFVALCDDLVVSIITMILCGVRTCRLVS